MNRETIKGVVVYKFPSSWWHVAFSTEFNEYVIIETHELPEIENLEHFKSDIDSAIQMARELNSDIRKIRANGGMIRL